MPVLAIYVCPSQRLSNLLGREALNGPQLWIVALSGIELVLMVGLCSVLARKDISFHLVRRHCLLGLDALLIFRRDLVSKFFRKGNGEFWYPTLDHVALVRQLPNGETFLETNDPAFDIPLKMAPYGIGKYWTSLDGMDTDGDRRTDIVVAVSSTLLVHPVGTDALLNS